MNYPPIFEVIANDPGASAILSDSEFTRFYPAGEAPTDTDRPYGTWQMISGFPENFLGTRPDIDQYTLQVDLWADTLTEVRNAAAAVRGAVEPHSYIVAYRSSDKETGTGFYHISFDVDWYVPR